MAEAVAFPGAVALVIDDESQIRRAVHNALTPIVQRVLEAATGSDGLDLAASERPALVILDLGLPDMSGISVCSELRRWSTAVLIVLSARHSPDEKAMLLDAGADDYMTKPFSTVELQARVRAQLRRWSAGGTSQDTELRVADLHIDLARRILRRGGEIVHLTPTEWDLLRTFATHMDKTLTHRHLFGAVWGRSPGDPQQYLRVYVANLRRKIEDDPLRPQFIVTEPGVGYRFQRPTLP
ncbi:MAG TPA: response regulator transcription factor [Longimicrobiales bacterium]|nr:response regulator transcription factor [Longimicrobiales bacterium]